MEESEETISEGAGWGPSWEGPGSAKHPETKQEGAQSLNARTSDGMLQTDAHLPTPGGTGPAVSPPRLMVAPHGPGQAAVSQPSVHSPQGSQTRGL